MTHPERVYTREQLLDHVWGGNVYVEERTVDVHIRRLRKALEPFTLENLVQTVRGSGYRFSASLSKLSRNGRLAGRHGTRKRRTSRLHATCRAG
jgi:DNA-binding winged helix-turn-helix (wHTH) protein